jgi:trimeric autotransporter adhesin
MSTKTTFKRIALVAVAALGLGVLSVAPSSATVSGLTVTVANGTAGLPGAASDSTTAATVTVAGLMEAGDSITVEIIAKSWPSTAVIGAASAALTQVNMFNLESTTPFITGYTVETLTAASFAAANAIAAGTGNAFVKNTSTKAQVSNTGTVIRVSKQASAANVSHKFGFQLDSITTADGGADSRTAGTYTYTALIKAYGSTATPAQPTQTVIQDFSIVIAPAASASETPSAGFSSAFLGDAATTAASADAAGVTGVATAGTLVGNLNVRVRNALDGVTAVDTVTITVTGPGLIDNGNNDTKFLRVVGQTGDVNYPIIADGTAGRTTITVAYEVTKETYTKTLTFYAVNAATITTSVRTPVLKVGTNAGAVGATAVDANGNAWTGTAYIVASSAADALIAGSTTPQACSYTLLTGIRCDITGATAGTAKFKVIDAATVATAKATSAEFSVTVSAATAARVVVEFDKSSYQPFEKATIMVSAVDAAGNLVPANTFATLFAAGGISASQAFSGTSDTLTAVSITTATATSAASGTVALKRVYTVYMPAQGDVVLSWTGGTSLPAAGQVAGTVTASVTNSSADAATDAANEATDAANAATDAALAAADAADAATAAAQDASDAVAALSASVSKLISSLRAQITSLTNLVIKIQKKVRA